MLARADELLYTRKRAGKKMQQPADRHHHAPGQPAQAESAPLHVLVDLTCPRCHKKNSVALDTQDVEWRGFCLDRKSTGRNSSHANTSYAVFCFKKKKKS